MIELRNLTIKAQDFETESLSLSVRPGEVHGLIGPSGSGKTLILETIAGLHKPHKGNILIDGKDITLLQPEKRAFAYVPQDASLFPHLSVEENIGYGVKVSNKGINSEMKDYIRHLCERLNIQHLLERSPAKLSGGERQRVTLARALAIRPRLILLDEPMSALDPAIKEETYYLFKELHRELKFTAFLVTHDFEEAFFLSDVFSILIDGKIRQTGKRKEVLYHPKDIRVARFLGVTNLFEGYVEDISQDYIVLSWRDAGEKLVVRRTFRDRWVTEDTDLIWGVRPEDVHIIKGDRKVSGENLFDVNLLSIYSGKNIHNLVSRLNQDSAVIKISVRDIILQKLGIHAGSELQIHINPETIILLPPEG